MDSKPKAYDNRVQTVEVSPNRDGQRLDNFLARHLKGVPRGALYRLIRTGQVRVNGGRARPDRKLSAGDQVRIPPVSRREDGAVTVSDEVCSQVEAAILFEDDELMVVNKPSGMAVHAGSGLPWGLIDAVRQIRPGKDIELAHRLDRETSGVMVLACNREALNSLAEQFRSGRVSKRYLCLLSGPLKEAVVSVDAPIAAGREDGEKHMKVDEDGRRAETRFKALKNWPHAAYAQVEIGTGRTHQIRVHARHLGTPVAGDRRYGNEEDNRRWRELGLRRLFLHASELEIDTPAGERLNFSAPMPLELRNCLDALDALEFPTHKG